MSTPKMTKLSYVLKLEDLILFMKDEVGFLDHEIKDIVREVLKKRKKPLYHHIIYKGKE